MNELPDQSQAEKIMHHCLLVNDYLRTIKKSIMSDGQDIDGFVDHYSDLIEMAIALNWRNHNVAEKMSIDEFRRNQKLD
ncbi:MAG: hypothetical protein QNJ72_14145 [Pleurocapsa sp. MO_226.B13]|nr:hypothetical protein [Pleurocapsa sp. MO_226.B13]